MSNERRNGNKNPSTVSTSRTAVQGNKQLLKNTEKNPKPKDSKSSVPRKKSIPTKLRGIPKTTKGKISYVLDTNVLMGDANSIYRFEEHDVYLVSQVLKELDNHKKGHSSVAINSRRATRIIDRLSKGKTTAQINNGIPLIPPAELQNGKAHNGKLFFDFSNPSVPKGANSSCDLTLDEPDDRIILICLSLKGSGKQVVLVSNDGNARIKARAYGIDAEEYLNETATNIVGEEDKNTGFHILPDNIWNEIEKEVKTKSTEDGTTYTLQHSFFKKVNCNEFLIFPADSKGATLNLVVTNKETQQRITAKTLTRYDNIGIKPKNQEQEFAIELLMNPNITCVSLGGLAGSGKTICALAAAMHQSFDTKEYNKTIITRVTIGSDEDIGFLPGNEEEKMDPWMGSMHDNMDILLNKEDCDDGCKNLSKAFERNATADILKSKIRVKSLNFMKGRTFVNTLLIVDEAQDLTVKKLKMIITRIGLGSKIIFLGNVAQIDDPFLNEHSSGISALIRSFSDSTIYGHVTLQQGERSQLATEAEHRL